MLEQSLRKLFEHQAEVELPPGQVTVAEVLRLGRLRRRRRRIGAVGTPVLAAVAVAAVALTSALPSGTLGRTGPQTGGDSRLGGAFDPSYLAIRLGWLPAGATVTGGEIIPGGEALSVAAPHNWVWAVGAYARNVCHVTKTRRFECLRVVSSPTLVLTDTLSIGGHGPVIDGHESRWLQGGYGTILAWQYAPGAWAVVQSSSGPATAARIARGVEYDQHVPVRFASRFTSLPHGWRISGLVFSREKGAYVASTYALGRPRTIRPTTSVFAAARDNPIISIGPANSASRCGFDPHVPVRQVTIHGYRLKVQRSTSQGPGGKFDLVMSTLCGNHVDGLLIWVAELNVGRSMFPPTEVMERTQLLGPNAADWVTSPLP